MKKLTIFTLMIMGILVFAYSSQASDQVWQDSKAYADISQHDITDRAQKVDAVVRFLEWYKSTKDRIAFVYPESLGEKLQVIAIVRLRENSYLAVAPKENLFAYADTMQGAVEELFGGESRRDIRYFSVDEALMITE